MERAYAVSRLVAQCAFLIEDLTPTAPRIIVRVLFLDDELRKDGRIEAGRTAGN